MNMELEAMTRDRDRVREMFSDFRKRVVRHGLENYFKLEALQDKVNELRCLLHEERRREITRAENNLKIAQDEIVRLCGRNICQ